MDDFIWGVHSLWADGTDNLVMFFRSEAGAKAWVEKMSWCNSPNQRYEIEMLKVEP